MQTSCVLVTLAAALNMGTRKGTRAKGWCTAMFNGASYWHTFSL